MEKKEHIPVMPDQALELLRVQKNGIYIDATLGGGGHAAPVAALLGKEGKIIAIDRDIEAIKRAKSRLARYGDKIFYFHSNFRELDRILGRLAIKKVEGILFDLGVSTYQLLESERGFSFSEKKENLGALLDMRMDRSQKLNAYKVINQYQEEELRDILFKLGEEPYAKKIAKRIVLERKIKPIKTTNDLLEIIRKSTPPKYRFSRQKGHYASKVFRAIRMEVNQELPALEEVIPKAIKALKKGGRLVIISFHSLEDRIVKRMFRDMASGDNKNPAVKLLTKKPLLASEEEIKNNPKADSAKLRALEKL